VGENQRWKVDMVADAIPAPAGFSLWLPSLPRRARFMDILLTSAYGTKRTCRSYLDMTDLCAHTLERDEYGWIGIPLQLFCLSMILSENRIPLFRIML
jgi:hypothetical protein